MAGTESKILEALEKVEFGASCTEISKQIDVSRPTVLKYLEVMKAKGLLEYKEVGMAKLWHTHKPSLLELLEKEKKKADHKLKELLDTLGDGVAILDKELKFIWVNKIFEKQIGSKLSKIRGKYCYEVLRERREICPECCVIKTLQTGKVETCEKIYQDAKSKKRHYDILTSPMRDKENNIVGVLLLRRDITERKKLEEALRKSEERYVDIVNNTNVAVYRNSPGMKGKHIDVNPAYMKVFGYENKEEIINTPVIDRYIDKKEKKKFDKLMKEQGHVENLVLRYKRRDGSIIWVREKTVVIRDEKGNIKYYDGIIEDITERKRLKEALRKSEEKYLEIYDNINIAIYRTIPGKKGKVIDVNPAQLRMFGYDSKEEMLEIKPSGFYKNPEDRERWEKEILEKGFLRNHEIQFKRNDGSVIWCLDTAVVVKDSEGKVKYYDGFIEDITKRKKLEEALKKSEERYVDIVNNTNVAVYRTTPGRKGKHIDVNPAYVKIFGYKDKGEVLNTAICDTYADLKEKNDFEKIMKKEGYVENWEAKYKKKDGSILWIRENAVAVKDEKGNIMYYDGTIEDITERKKLEDILKDSEERYRDIFDNSYMGVCRVTLGPKGKFIDANPAYVKFLGYKSKEDLLKVNVCDTYQNLRDRKKFSDKLLKQGYLEDEITKVKRKDGTPILFRENARVIYDEKGKVKYFDCMVGDITERKKLEEALKESEEEHRSLVENAPDVIYSLNARGEFISINTAGINLLGYSSKEELLGSNFSKVVHPEDLDKAVKSFKEQVTGKKDKTERLELRFKTKKGEVIWGELNSKAIYDKKGNFLKSEGVVRDITEKKRLERALKESEEKYRDIFENINVGIHRVTPGKKGGYVDANPSFLRIYGYKNKEELLKINVCDVYRNPKDREKFNEKILRQGYVKDEILKQKKKDGTPILLRENSVVVYDKNGKPKYFDCMAEDITAQVRLGEELKEAEERYRNIFENMNVGIYRATPGKKGKFIEVNPAYLKILGYRNKEELSRIKTVSDYTNPEDKERFDQKMLEQGYVESKEIQYKKGDGSTVWVRESAVAVKDENGKVKYYDGVIEDITEKKKLEEALKKSEERHRSLVENVPDLVYSLNAKGELISVNKAAVDLLGYSKEELLESHFSKVIVKEDLEKAAKSFKELAERKRDVTKGLELRFKTKDGGIIYGELNAKASYDSKGKLLRTEGIIRDIAERKKMEKRY